MLSNGEFVIRAAMVRKWGASFFNALNAGFMPPMPKYAMGGAVNIPSMPSSSETMTVMFRAGESEMPVRMLRNDKSMLQRLIKELNRSGLVGGV